MKWAWIAGGGVFVLLLAGWFGFWYSTASDLQQITRERLDHYAGGVSKQDSISEITYADVSVGGFPFTQYIVVNKPEINVRAPEGIYTLKAAQIQLDLIEDGHPGYQVVFPESVTAIREGGGAKTEWNLQLISMPTMQILSLSDDDTSVEAYTLKFTRRIAMNVQSEGTPDRKFIYTPAMDRNPPRNTLPSVVSFYVRDVFRVWE